MSPKVTEEYKEQRRREILEAATRVFARKGFEPATMKDIVEESGKSFGGVYMYYSNTKDILKDLLSLSDKQVIDVFPDVSLPAWERIKWMLEMQRTLLGESINPLFAIGYEYFITAWRDEERAAQLQIRFSEMVEWIAEVIREGIRSGEFNPLYQVEDIVELMISTLEGIRFNRVYLGMERLHVSRQLQVFQGMLAHALQIGGNNE